jgi:6,7-dimethyl-8-ribityllumazine synthase
MKIAIISSDFWKEIVTNLENDCIFVLEKNNIPKNQIDVIRVPGSFEIPLTAKKLAKTNNYDAIIAFGAIHKGDTYHFELIANECARGCMNVMLEHQIPVIFEVLAVYDIQDAIKRSQPNSDLNKGTEAALAAIKMIALLEKI